MRINGFGRSSRDAASREGQSGAGQLGVSGGNGCGAANGPGGNSDGAQLSRLSSVLNGLESGASAIRRHVYLAMGAVRSGTYKVDALQLSKRIVGEALGSA
jgi:hypothetical protein